MFEEDLKRRELLELAEDIEEHDSEILEEKLKEDQQQLSELEIIASLLQREDELQELQKKLVSVPA